MTKPKLVKTTRRTKREDERERSRKVLQDISRRTFARFAPPARDVNRVMRPFRALAVADGADAARVARIAREAALALTTLAKQGRVSELVAELERFATVREEEWSK